jgi:hypothetical protein
MLQKLDFFDYILENKNAQTLLADAQKICDNLTATVLQDLGIRDYHYDPKEAMEELGLDEKLIEQLVADYVAQIIRSVVQFEDYIKALQNSKENHTQLDYTLFRELAHKNLGVARNLRIKDAEKLLYELMKKDDLEYLIVCLEALKVCAIKLNPQCAYETIKLIHLKKSI